MRHDDRLALKIRDLLASGVLPAEANVDQAARCYVDAGKQTVADFGGRPAPRVVHDLW